LIRKGSAIDKRCLGQIKLTDDAYGIVYKHNTTLASMVYRRHGIYIDTFRLL